MTTQKNNPLKKSFIISMFAAISLGAASLSLAAKPVHESFFIPDAFLFIGECDGFEIINVSDLEITVTSFFDNNGDFVRNRAIFKVLNSVYFNSVDPGLSLEGGPGEVEIGHFNAVENTLALTGASFRVTVPGVGVIYLDAGRTLFDFNTGEITKSGPSDFEDGNVDALCDALTAI